MIIVRVVSEHPLTLERVAVAEKTPLGLSDTAVIEYYSEEVAKHDLHRVAKQHGGYLYLLVDDVVLEVE
jgi:hypothetical protein